MNPAKSATAITTNIHASYPENPDNCDKSAIDGYIISFSWANGGVSYRCVAGVESLEIFPPGGVFSFF
jgi:hypothetical protein